MTEIDWNQLAQDAEDSPRGLLAELIGQADEIKDIVIVFTTGEEGSEFTHTWASARHQAMMIAMLDYARWYECRKMYEEQNR